MTVERVVAGVDHGAGEPAAIKTHRRIEDLFRRLDPVDLARGLAPKALGIPERAGMDRVIPAVVLDVHGVAPGGYNASNRHARDKLGHDKDQFRPNFLRTSSWDHCHLGKHHFKAKTP